MKRANRTSTGIQYFGTAGVTEECKNAVMRLVQFGDHIQRTRILSCSREHCLLLTTDIGDLIAVKSGFASGYLGEGPRGLAFVLRILEAQGAEIDEVEVGEDVIIRVDENRLSDRELKDITGAKIVRPARWRKYAFEGNLEADGRLWCEFPPVVPFGIIDNRIMDLALQFSHRPDDSLLTGYRRLEDIVRKRTGIAEHGVKLFSQAFDVSNGKLCWTGLCEAEQKGRGLLFTAAYMAYRNPRAHRELDHDRFSQLREFLCLNGLYVLEHQASEKPQGGPKKNSPTVTSAAGTK